MQFYPSFAHPQRLVRRFGTIAMWTMRKTDPTATRQQFTGQSAPGYKRTFRHWMPNVFEKIRLKWFTWHALYDRASASMLKMQEKVYQRTTNHYTRRTVHENKMLMMIACDWTYSIHKLMTSKNTNYACIQKITIAIYWQKYWSIRPLPLTQICQNGSVCF